MKNWQFLLVKLQHFPKYYQKLLDFGGYVQNFLEFRTLSKYLLGQLSFGAIVSMNGAKWKFMPILGQMSMGKFLWGNSRSIGCVRFDQVCTTFSTPETKLILLNEITISNF